MRNIELDATEWTCIDDFYRALLPALGACEGHGTGINAIIDSMIWGGMNDIEPPYRVVVKHTSGLPHDVMEHLKLAKYHLTEARAEFQKTMEEDVDVSLDMAD